MPESADYMFQRVREAVAGSYDLLGEIGHDEHGVPLDLARALPTGSLVGVHVKQDDVAGTEFTVEVRRTLGESIAVKGSSCPECGTALPDLERFCFHCGADLSGVVAPDNSPESARLLAALAAATAGRYEILGRMDREGKAGTVYFARDLQSRRIIALRMRRAEAGDAVQAEYVVNQTMVFRGPITPPANANVAPANVATASSTHASVVAAAAASAAAVAAASAATMHLSQPSHAPNTAPASATSNPSASGAHAPYANAVENVPAGGGAIATKPARSSAALLGGAVLVLLATVGYFALGSNDDVSTVPVVAPLPAPVLPAPDTTPVVPTPNVATAVTTTDSTATTVLDSGTVRLVAALPENARITIDGRTVRGRTFRLAAGHHVFAVTAPGYDRFSQRLNVRAGSDAQWAPRVVATVASIAPPTVVADSQRPRRETASCRTAVRGEDWASAFTLCTNESNTGDIPATSNLARLYARGLGTRRSASQAFTLYAKAAAGGDRDAQTALGYALRDGVEIKRDPAQSVRWFKAAAEQGDRAAQLEYAVALEKGEGTSKDEKSARDWFKKAAEQGNFMAARRLAKMFERGAGGSRDDAEAAVTFERAATLGDPESALAIARRYRDGRGVAKSTEKALTWFKKAVDLGNREADAELKRLDKGEL
ncbi:MAG: hypothetical protein ABIW79_07300 [Gemmatimonas sp.]